MEVIVGLLLGLCVALAVVVLILFMRRRPAATITVTPGGIETLERVGELVVLRAKWSIPAIGEDHVLGDVGRKFLRWLWSENKTIMIFRFEIRFKFDLRDRRSVRLSSPDPATLDIQLGEPDHEINLDDVKFYHTEKGQLLDWLLPRALNIFTSDMDDTTRQRILDAARDNAIKEAEKLAGELVGDARMSAEATLSALGRSAGFEKVRFVKEAEAESPATV
jgi:hypothetical protein